MTKARIFGCTVCLAVAGVLWPFTAIVLGLSLLVYAGGCAIKGYWDWWNYFD